MKNQRTVTRRSFLQHSLAGAAVTAGAVTYPRRRLSANFLGANETIRVAIAGLNGRGSAHVAELVNLPNVQITHLVDPDSRTFGPRLKQISDAQKPTPETVADIRRVLDNPDVDVVTIATPNHWHALMTIWSCQAGKDVYVEKPCSHNIHEGRIAVEMARKHGRIVQHGTQNRSAGGWAGAIEFIKSGKAGNLKIARGLCYKPRGSIGFQSPESPPTELDFDLWLGPAQKSDYHKNLVPYNWHWFWATGNGDIGNQGVHQMDVARWGIDGATLPTSVLSFGGRFGYKDQGETANTQVTVFDYGKAKLVFEVRGLSTSPYRGEKISNFFHCEGGVVTAGTFYPDDSDKTVSLEGGTLGPGNGHFDNFIAAVRSRKSNELNAEILEGHYSSALCHLANISYRLGSQVPFAPRDKQLSEFPDLAETIDRTEEHLSQENKIALDTTRLQLGRLLKFDPQTEKFTNDEGANKLLTRDYRPPFVVPDKV